MAFLKAYTKEIVPGTYDAPLAHSIHFAVSKDGASFTELNNGYGILFARGDVTEQNTIVELGLENPQISKTSDGFTITALQIEHDGASHGATEAWHTEDFIHFAKKNFAPTQTPATSSDACMIEISEDIYEKMCAYWIPKYDPSNVARWPLSVGYADPVIFKYEGAWFFLATNDNVNDIGLYLRKAATVEELFRNHDGSYPMDALPDGASESVILPYDEEHGFCQTFWAPEFHIIGGVPYILFAVSNQNWGPQCHMMRLKDGGDIMNPGDWELPVRVKRSDGSNLTDNGITLDMTYLKCASETPGASEASVSYVVWSYRYAINSPFDTGSMLYIASVNEKEPWKLTSEPRLLSRPLYGYENVAGTINNEGPYALVHDGKVYLAYSGGAACGYYYIVNYLVADESADLLDIENWTKLPTAQLSSSSIPGLIGPGHNSFFRGDDGETYIAYHVQDRGRFHKRVSTYHRVKFAEDGFPRLDTAVAERLY